MGARKQWSQYVRVIQEDECLQDAIKLNGTDDWGLISDTLKHKYGILNRNGKKCRERWINHIKPEVSKSLWSLDEEKILFRCQATYGNQWTEISKFLPGRTDNSIKNYFYSTLRRKMRWYNKQRGNEEKITITANEVSLIPQLTKEILETKDNKKIAKPCMM
jgi:Myb-like DNA-binding domain